MVEQVQSTAVQLAVMSEHIAELRRAIEKMQLAQEARRAPWWQWVGAICAIIGVIALPYAYYSQAIEQLRSDVRAAAVERMILRRDIDGLMASEKSRHDAEMMPKPAAAN